MDKNKACLTPPMGWNSYDYYNTSINEEEIKENARILAAKLLPSGWDTLVVDIEWYSVKPSAKAPKYQYTPFGELAMDEYGRLIPDPERFPSSVGGKGFGPIADYVHSLGLKFGIHIMRGIPRAAAQLHLPIYGSDMTCDDVADPANICFWNPDMYGTRPEEPGAQAYYDSIFKLYAEWGVDFIKCDDICREDQPSAHEEIRMLHEAIEKNGRPMVLSLSPGPAKLTEAWWYEQHANMWRITDDMWDKWELLLAMFERCEVWQRHVGNGNWPDCDMLPFGMLGKGFGGNSWKTNLTQNEQITLMTLWCIFRSPLMLGASLTEMDPWTLKLLTDRTYIDMNQYGDRPTQLERNEDGALWISTDTRNGGTFVAAFNFTEETVTRRLNVLGATKEVVIPAHGAVHYHI